jgi:hypothetical protein
LASSRANKPALKTNGGTGNGSREHYHQEGIDQADKSRAAPGELTFIEPSLPNRSEGTKEIKTDEIGTNI